MSEDLVVETPGDVVVEYIVPDVDIVEVSTPGPRGPQGVGSAGPTGPPGPQGPPGEIDVVQVFSFATPAMVWTIQHDRNSFDVDVVTFDVSGNLYEGNVRYIDANNIVVDWYYPTAGTARLST